MNVIQFLADRASAESLLALSSSNNHNLNVRHLTKQCRGINYSVKRLKWPEVTSVQNSKLSFGAHFECCVIVGFSREELILKRPSVNYGSLTLGNPAFN